jgi:hypothetical protein
MDVPDVPTALQDRLGPEATAGLIELLTEAREEWTAEMIERVGDRFERRLTDETTRVRIEMVQGFAAVRQELAEGLSQVRQEMMAGFAALRQEIAYTRFELLKWTFVFWVGQLFALAGFLAVLVRFLRPVA